MHVGESQNEFLVPRPNRFHHLTRIEFRLADEKTKFEQERKMVYELNAKLNDLCRDQEKVLEQVRNFSSERYEGTPTSVTLVIYSHTYPNGKIWARTYHQTMTEPENQR